MAEEQNTSGLVCVLAAVEPCSSFDIYRNKETKHLEVVRRWRKCVVSPLETRGGRGYRPPPSREGVIGFRVPDGESAGGFELLPANIRKVG